MYILMSRKLFCITKVDFSIQSLLTRIVMPCTAVARCLIQHVISIGNSNLVYNHNSCHRLHVSVEASKLIKSLLDWGAPRL